MLEELTNAWENEGWKQLDAFKDFRESMGELSDQQKLEQTMKANHFLEFARNALVTHFKIWVNDLLFLSLYSEQTTAHIVAKYLHDPNASTLWDPNDSPNHTPQVQLEEYLNVDLKDFRDGDGGSDHGAVESSGAGGGRRES